MTYSSVLYEKRGQIAVVTLNRPEKMNASTDIMYEELLDCFQTVDGDADLRVMIVTGAGKAFCAGADLQERFLPKIEQRKQGLLKDVTGEISERGALALSRIRKVTIAAVNGMATGVGCTLALGCDIRMASEKAKFGFPFLRVGILPEFGATYYLPRLVGIGKACELVFTGQTVGAQEAKEIGLVNQVVPPEKLMEETFAMAEKIVQMPSLALAVSKRALYQGLRAPDLASQLQYEALALVHLFGTADHEEAVKSFLEKREPIFKGR
jgi:2-(1,2-epoxy-1,2-dihydrophenyl)acetyl-CoA isomerase